MHHWPWVVPVLAWLALGLGLLVSLGWPLALICLPALIGAVLAAVHHAEIIAHRIGEPYGTLVLALAVTAIEVSLLISLMLSGGPDVGKLPRDTVFATIMIIANGVIGICLLLGCLKHREQSFRTEGTSAGLAALITLAVLTLVLPAFTTSTPGPTYTASQLAFAAVASLTLWGVFIFGQTVQYRDYFLPVGGQPDEHAAPPSAGAAWASLGLLLAALLAVVALAKTLSPLIDAGITAVNAPKTVLGIAIALLVLLPETWAAIRAARANRLQTSMNLALGSALATIGLTIPAVALAATILDIPLTLGLDTKDLVLLMTTFLVSAITLGSGRTNLIQGTVHLVLFAAFLFLALVP
jgi:Ca2+:H+ antiporter